MSSEEISLQNGLNVFQDDPIRTFNCGPATTARPSPKTRELTGFIDDKIFSFPSSQPPEFRSSDIYAAAASACTDRLDPPNHHHPNWGSRSGGGSTNSVDDESDGDGVDDEEDEDDDVDDDDGGDTVENNNNNHNNNININNHNSKNNSGNETVNNAGSRNPEKMGNIKAKHSFVGGSCRELVEKEGGSGVGQGVRENNNYQIAVTIADADGDIYYTRYLQGGEGSGGSGGGGNVQKDIVVENGGGGCGFSGRKDVSLLSESGDSLPAILSDPVTGALMDDAMILPCGHSFGAAGIQHVLRMKVCYTCSQSVSEKLVAPNLSLRAAVQAFRLEEELQFYRSPKRRRERFEQDKGSYGESNIMDTPRGRGVQFPFAVTDRVIIKGNKRTPQRFVGRKAVVTTQCLNGWYVVKTLDNAESVKLQYRSLAKVPDDPSSKPIGPNWL